MIRFLRILSCGLFLGILGSTIWAADATLPEPPATAKVTALTPGTTAASPDFWLDGKPYSVKPDQKQTETAASEKEKTTASNPSAVAANSAEDNALTKKQTSAPAPAKITQPCANYKIVAGDTLESIALAHHITVRAIKEANGLVDSRIRSGAMLKLPGVTKVVSNNNSSDKKAQQVDSKSKSEKAKDVAVATQRSENSVSKITDAPLTETAEANTVVEDALPLVEKEETVSAKSTSISSDLNKKAEPFLSGLNLSFQQGEDSGQFSVGTPAMLLSLVVKLGLVLGIAYLGILALKRLSGGRQIKVRCEASLQVVETVSLGTNRWIHLVTVEKQAFLIGSTPQQTSLLGEIKDSALFTEFSQPQSQPQTQQTETNFASRLAGLMAQNSQPAPTAGLSGTAQLLSQKVAELRKQNNSNQKTKRLG